MKEFVWSDICQAFPLKRCLRGHFLQRRGYCRLHHSLIGWQSQSKMLIPCPSVRRKWCLFHCQFDTQCFMPSASPDQYQLRFGRLFLLFLIEGYPWVSVAVTHSFQSPGLVFRRRWFDSGHPWDILVPPLLLHEKTSSCFRSFRWESGSSGSHQSWWLLAETGPRRPWVLYSWKTRVWWISCKFRWPTVIVGCSQIWCWDSGFDETKSKRRSHA